MRTLSLAPSRSVSTEDVGDLQGGPPHEGTLRRGQREDHVGVLHRQKVDIRVIQVLLGHKKLETTALYTQVGTQILRQVVSPIEVLPAP